MINCTKDETSYHLQIGKTGKNEILKQLAADASGAAILGTHGSQHRCSGQPKPE